MANRPVPVQGAGTFSALLSQALDSRPLRPRRPDEFNVFGEIHYSRQGIAQRHAESLESIAVRLGAARQQLRSWASGKLIPYPGNHGAGHSSPGGRFRDSAADWITAWEYSRARAPQVIREWQTPEWDQADLEQFRSLTFDLLIQRVLRSGPARGDGMRL